MKEKFCVAIVMYQLDQCYHHSHTNCTQARHMHGPRGLYGARATQHAEMARKSAVGRVWGRVALHASVP